MLSVDADRVILVACSGQTPKSALRRASELLMQVNARVMGVVLGRPTHTVFGRYFRTSWWWWLPRGTSLASAKLLTARMASRWCALPDVKWAVTSDQKRSQNRNVSRSFVTLLTTDSRTTEVV